MGEILVVHISKERYENIRSQGYQLLKYPSEDWKSIRARLGGGDTLYHLLDGDEGQCSECGYLQTSVKVENPSELETVKHQLRYGPFPTITMDRAGFDLDLAGFEWLGKQMELVRALSDYTCANVHIQRLPVERFGGGHCPSGISMPDTEKRDK